MKEMTRYYKFMSNITLYPNFKAVLKTKNRTREKVRKIDYYFQFLPLKLSHLSLIAMNFSLFYDRVVCFQSFSVFLFFFFF